MDTEERLEKLERELLAEKRRNRWLLVAVGLGVVGVLAWTLATITPTAQAQGANTGPKEIRANAFIVEDETGKSRAWLGVDENGPKLSLLDATGKPPAELGATKPGPGLLLQDENGNPRAMLSVGPRDGPTLLLLDANGKTILSQP